MDFDGDGDTDILSGSFPGALYFFRRSEDGSFEAGVTIKDRDGKEINTGNASTAFAFDWDSDGDLDLITGNISGQVHLVVNEGARKEPSYGEAVTLDVGDVLDGRRGDSGAIVADWDGDGRHDLLVGMCDGSVVWFRNTGTVEKPELAAGEELVPKSEFGFNLVEREPGQWGARVKIHAVDFNGDGRLDLLLGDRSGGPPPKKLELTDQQKEELEAAKERLPELRREQMQSRLTIRRLQEEAEQDEPKTRELEAARAKYQGLSEEYREVTQTIRQFTPQPVRNGFVWLFERAAASQVAQRPTGES